MCFRLLLATPEAQNHSDASTLESLAFACGLDIRLAARGPLQFVELSWGDCACSLYTQREGRQRAVRFTEVLRGAGREVQLLLLTDGATLDEARDPVTIRFQDFREQGLAALPEGRVAILSGRT